MTAMTLFIRQLLMLALILVAWSAGAAAPPTKVSLQLEWKHQFEFAGFYAAKEKGFYQEAGLDVEFVEYDGKDSIVERVMAGDRDFELDGSKLVADRLNGTPVVMLANYFKRSPKAIVTRPEIRLPSDLKGKRLMISDKDADSLGFRVMFERFGLKMQDMTRVPISFDVRDFIDGKVDAMSLNPQVQ